MEAKYTISLSEKNPMVLIRADSLGELTSALEALHAAATLPDLVHKLHGDFFPGSKPHPLSVNFGGDR